MKGGNNTIRRKPRETNKFRELNPRRRANGTNGNTNNNSTGGAANNANGEAPTPDTQG